MTAVEFLEQELDKYFEIKGNSFLFDTILRQAKKMEDSQATDYAKWSIGIYEITGNFFTFLEWIKDEPKDDE